MCKIIVNKKVKAWSFSSYQRYMTCKFRWAKQWVEGVKEEYEYNYAMERGTEIHLKAEHYVQGNITGMPKELKNFSGEFKELKKLGAETEVDLAITKELTPTHAKDWDNVWCRAKVDSRVVTGACSTIIDYKTGKVYNTSEEQCEVYAVCEAVHRPKSKIIDTELWYLDIGETVSFSFTKKDVNKLTLKWIKKVAPMFDASQDYIPTPSYQCKYCSYAKDKGGSCKYDSKGNA